MSACLVREDERVTRANPHQGKLVSILISVGKQSRVEEWRGGWCSVSTPRSSNRTGRFPASGFRTRRFTRSLTRWLFVLFIGDARA